MAASSKTPPKTKPSRQPIVSSAHLAAGRMPALSELEFSLTLAATAYQRWMVRCMTAAGMPQLSPTEILILHTVRHRDKPKRFMDIQLVLDVEETHLVTYAVRKLERLGLVAPKRAGQEKLIEITPAGLSLCTKYGNLREDLLVLAVVASNANESEISNVATLLRVLSGIYNQAARAAATM
jgi:predicted MarR family transcription regulator